MTVGGHFGIHIENMKNAYKNYFMKKIKQVSNIFVKSIIVQKIVYTSIYDINMSPEHFEKKNKDLRSL